MEETCVKYKPVAGERNAFDEQSPLKLTKTKAARRLGRCQLGTNGQRCSTVNLVHTEESPAANLRPGNAQMLYLRRGTASYEALHLSALRSDVWPRVLRGLTTRPVAGATRLLVVTVGL